MRLPWRISIIVLLAIAIIVIGTYLFLFQFGGIESIVVHQIDNALGEESRFDIEVGDISGSLMSGVVVKNVRVSYRDSTGLIPLLSVDELMARYSISNIFDRKYIFENVHVGGLDLTIRQDIDGNWIIPLPPVSGGGSGEGSDAPAFQVDHLTIADSRVRLERLKDTLEFRDITLSASVMSEGNTYALQVAAARFQSSDPTMSLDDLRGKVTIDGRTITFQDVQLRRGGLRFRVSGTFDIGQLIGVADVSVDALDLAELSPLIGVKLDGVIDFSGRLEMEHDRLHARVNIGGDFLLFSFENLYLDLSYADRRITFDTLYGTILGRCGVDGSGYIDLSASPERYYLGAEIRGFDLNQIVPNSFVSDLSGYISLDGTSFRSADMLLKVNVDLYESVFDDFGLHYASGEIDITTDSLRFPVPFRVDYFENVFTAVGTVDYGGDLYLQVDGDLANLDRFREQFFINQPGGRGITRVTFAGRTADPDIRGWFASDSLWVYGLYADSGYADFEIERFLSGRRGWATAFFLSGAAWDIPYDSGFIDLAIDSTLVEFGKAELFGPYTTLKASGRLDQNPQPWLLSADSVELTVFDLRFNNRGPVNIEVDSLGFGFLNSALGWRKGLVTADGRVNFDETMSLVATADQIPIAPWLHLFDTTLTLDGLLSGRIELDGDFYHPVFRLAGGIDSLVYRGLKLGDLDASFAYSGRLLSIDSLVIISDSGQYRGSGQLHADLGFTSDVSERLLDLPLDIRFTAADRKFDLAEELLPSVETIDGFLQADIRVSGTPSDPRLEGIARLRPAIVKYLDLADPLAVDSANFILQSQLVNGRFESSIRFDNVEAYPVRLSRRDRSVIEQRLEGRVRLDGSIGVLALDSLEWDVTVDIDPEILIRYDLDDITAKVSGDLTITGSSPPLVEGDLTILSGRYQAEFADAAAGSPLMLALEGNDTWDLNIGVEIVSNYWVRNEDIDAEVSGDMNVVREDNQYRYAGTINLDRGKGYLFDKTFRIDGDSSRVTFEDIEYPDPQLDIYARTRIPVAPTAEGERSYLEVAVHVSGTLDNPTFQWLDVETGETLSDEAVVPLLAANYYSESGSGGAFEQRLSSLISSQVAQLGGRQLAAIGVETFEIDPAYEGGVDLARTKVTVGGYAGSSLYWYTSYRYESGAGFGFEYRLNRSMLLEGTLDEDQLYNLNVKWQKEFEEFPW